MRRLYSLLIYCALPFALGAVLWRGLRDRSYLTGWNERCGFGRASAAPSIWLHAVSLGEMTAAAPLVRALHLRYPQYPLLLTTATPTGRARASALFGETMDVRFLPYDTPGAVARFLDRIRPRLGIIMETELWPNLFKECERRGVPLVLASARLSAKSVARYQRFGGLIRRIFSSISLIAAQSREDAQRFVAIGAQSARTHVVGNLKFDMESSAEDLFQGAALRSSLGDTRPIWIAGSTHAGEEELVLAAHQELRAAQVNALLLLVPRHPDRFPAVTSLLNREGWRFTRWSTGVMPDRSSQVVLVDTVGELAALYAAVDVAFVGGSLVPVGGHNLLEPASFGLPVLTGPHNFNGKDIARLLLIQGAALQVDDAKQLAASVAKLLADPAQRQRMGAIGRHIVESNRGSTARLVDLISEIEAPDRSAAAAVAARPSTGC